MDAKRKNFKSMEVGLLLSIAFFLPHCNKRADFYSECPLYKFRVTMGIQAFLFYVQVCDICNKSL